MNQREIALEILYKTIKAESYSNLLMRQTLKQLEPIQRAFVTELVNGVLRNYQYLEYQFQNEITKSTSLKNRLIVCLALYERFFMNQKDYVVNNEYVKLASNKYDKAFINALLHKVKEFSNSNEPYIQYSLPEWLYRLLLGQYGQEDTLKILKIYQKVPKTYYRMNHSKWKANSLKGIEFVNDDIFVCSTSLFDSEEFKKGYFYVQDINSASLYKELDLNPENTLLDVCAAPGSKLFNCLDILEPKNCVANDLHENRVAIMEKMGHKLGFDGVTYICHDGRELKDHLHSKFDRILLDVPCSGLGVIGRKPDLKFHIQPSNLDELELLQKQLLDATKDLLKKDGILLYSTCTLNKKENGRRISAFLKENDDFILLKEDTIMNEIGDCFYYAKLKRN